MSVYPAPTRNASIFNPALFTSSSSSSTTLTVSQANSTYAKLAGGQTILSQETFQGGVLTNAIGPWSGTTVSVNDDLYVAGAISTPDNIVSSGTVQGSILSAVNSSSIKDATATSLQVSGTVTCTQIINTGNITSSFTTLPTFTSDNIGYSAIYTLSTATNVAAGYNVLNTTGASLPIGVWRVDALAALSATSSNYTVTGFYVGVYNSPTALATYSNTVGGLRYDRYSSSHTVVYNDTRFQPMFKYSQTLTVSAATTLYGFFYLNSGSGGTLVLSNLSYLQVTRVA